MKTKKDYIKKWCETALTKTKYVNRKAPSSYGLKHMCENSIGEYVSNDEMKEVMRELGFKCISNGTNEDYNILAIVNHVVFENRLNIVYKNKKEGVYHPRAETITI